MKTLLALTLLAAACSGSPKPAPTTGGDGAMTNAPPTGGGGAMKNDPPMGNDAPPSPIPTDAASRKHAFVRTADTLPWMNNTARLATDLRLQRVAQGNSFDITDGPVVVVAGKVANAQNQELAYWNKKPHRIQCAKGADCILLVHANAAAAAPGELLVQDLKWTPLDPSRPDPLVVPLWGDGTKEPNGFLMKMKAGGGPFWHIHHQDYSGVVLAGNVVSYESGHEAEEMPPGSYWWQPNGNKHTTDCKGPSDCVIYLDFTGAFDVKAVP
jgi:quercetin dioxygenase-like cupin family protein